MDAIDEATAQIVLRYWEERSHVKPRSEALRQRHLKRILKRLGEGFSAAELQRCVDVACWDDFYVQKGYYKQPDVIFRNAERVERLLTVWKHETERPVPL